MNSKQFAKFEARDQYCLHCGQQAPYLVPHHRANRGMGGDKSAGKDKNKSSNILAICTILNGLMESDPAVAEVAREYGWKLNRYQNPTEVPIWDKMMGEWYLLTDDFRKVKTTAPD